MDMAKIRKKALQSRMYSAVYGAASAPASVALMAEEHDSASVAPPVSVTPEDDPQESSLDDFFDSPAVPLPLSLATAATPLETILAARKAAGCDGIALITHAGAGDETAGSVLELLLFRVANEMYGIDIMDIKEIIKLRPVTEVPRSPAFVAGVVSLRGVILPIIDVRIRLGLKVGETTAKGRIIVVRNRNSLCGLLVDEVMQVVQVQRDSLESPPAVLEGVDRDFVSGLGRSGEVLIIILNLDKCVDFDIC